MPVVLLPSFLPSLLPAKKSYAPHWEEGGGGAAKKSQRAVKQRKIAGVGEDNSRRKVRRKAAVRRQRLSPLRSLARLR